MIIARALQAFICALDFLPHISDNGMSDVFANNKSRMRGSEKKGK
jgi:hypothetical protein